MNINTQIPQSSEEPMTVRGKKILEEELNHLIKVEREQNKVALVTARELGDLKENAEYQAAKEKQSQIEGRILEIQGKLGRAKVIDPKDQSGEKIVFGALVELFDEEKNKTLIYQIVGVDEAREEGKISYHGPLGRALIGKEEGDVVQFQAPKGMIEYQIMKVSYNS